MKKPLEWQHAYVTYSDGYKIAIEWNAEKEGGWDWSIYDVYGALVFETEAFCDSLAMSKADSALLLEKIVAAKPAITSSTAADMEYARQAEYYRKNPPLLAYPGSAETCSSCGSKHYTHASDCVWLHRHVAKAYSLTSVDGHVDYSKPVVLQTSGSVAVDNVLRKRQIGLAGPSRLPGDWTEDFGGHVDYSKPVVLKQAQEFLRMGDWPEDFGCEDCGEDKPATKLYPEAAPKCAECTDKYLAEVARDYGMVPKSGYEQILAQIKAESDKLK